jgi:hypothetical protein
MPGKEVLLAETFAQGVFVKGTSACFGHIRSVQGQWPN